MILGVPTLCRYDLLERLVRSAEAGEEKPTGYVIVDNGGGLEFGRVRSWIARDMVPISLRSPGSNLGVAASWNAILDHERAPVIISNDDIVLHPETFREMATALSRALFVEGDGWALFGQRPEVVDLVGYYDENFWPAYYEDVDYDLRLRRARLVPVNPLSRPVHHEGWATQKSVGGAAWLREGREKNHAYFLAKWGGESANPRWNGHPGIVHFEEPFNGKPPSGWRERAPMNDPIPMHWDVLNFIAKQIGATRYLEIGVENGECLQKIDVREKWGVDPGVVVTGVKAADVFIPKSSREFFQMGGLPTFDLVFIDGDHTAEVVYDEVMDAVEILSPRGVICLHDTNPTSEDMQTMPWHPGLWTGDVWKTVAQLREESFFAVRTVPFDYGTTILVPTTEMQIIGGLLPCHWRDLRWSHLVEARESLLGILGADEWKDWVRTATRIP